MSKPTRISDLMGFAPLTEKLVARMTSDQARARTTELSGLPYSTITAEEWNHSREASVQALVREFEEVWQQLCLFLGEEEAAKRLDPIWKELTKPGRALAKKRNADPIRYAALDAHEAAVGSAAKRSVINKYAPLVGKPNDSVEEQRRKLRRWFDQTKTARNAHDKDWSKCVDANIEDFHPELWLPKNDTSNC
jgi:hypothetical protein